jgi:hypothetical protein
MKRVCIPRLPGERRPRLMMKPCAHGPHSAAAGCRSSSIARKFATYFDRVAGLREAAAHRRRAEGLDVMEERVTFWYGCNVLRHGDIIHACLDILRASATSLARRRADYCCGTVKDANQAAAGGMATRTVGKLNERTRASSPGARRAIRTCTTSWKGRTSGTST